MPQGNDDGIEFVGKSSYLLDLTSKGAAKKTTIVLDEDSKSQKFVLTPGGPFVCMLILDCSVPEICYQS